ncbi:MAG: GAF domain-containing protein [Planctomycetota bacterium]
MDSASEPLLTKLDSLLEASPIAWPEVLAALADRFSCPVATAHLLGDDGMLHLAAQQGLPPPVLDKVQLIPIGKGMAGIAAERKEPVQVCNLQTDDSGVARPTAKMTQMEGSLASPMLDGDRLRGVLGIAKPTAYDFTPTETGLLLEVGARLAKHV